MILSGDILAVKRIFFLPNKKLEKVLKYFYFSKEFGLGLSVHAMLCYAVGLVQQHKEPKKASTYVVM